MTSPEHFVVRAGRTSHGRAPAPQPDQIGRTFRRPFATRENTDESSATQDGTPRDERVHREQDCLYKRELHALGVAFDVPEVPLEQRIDRVHGCLPPPSSARNRGVKRLEPVIGGTAWRLTPELRRFLVRHRRSAACASSCKTCGALGLSRRERWYAHQSHQ